MMLFRLCLLIITLITECVVSQNPGKITALNLSAYFVNKKCIIKHKLYICKFTNFMQLLKCYRVMAYL